MRDGTGTDHVAELDRLLRESQESASRMRRMQIFATVALVAVFVVSLFAMYGTAKSMYTAEEFQASLEPQLQELQPEFEQAVRDVVDTAGPHYAQLGRERLDAALPKLGAAMESEMAGLSDGLANRAQTRVSAALERVHAAQLERLAEVYPDLDADTFAKLRTKWAREVQQDTEEVVVDFHDRVSTDFANLSNTIESFSPSKYDDYSQDDLVRVYAHLWLNRIDYEILAGVDEGGGNDG